MDEKKSNIMIENRERVNLTGVIDIHSFDDELVLVETNLGIITLKGINLKINKLNLDSNELSVEGKVNSLCYSENMEQKKSNMIGKLFK